MSGIIVIVRRWDDWRGRYAGADRSGKLLCFQPTYEDAERLCQAMAKEWSSWRNWLRRWAAEESNADPHHIRMEHLDQLPRGHRRRAGMIDGTIPALADNVEYEVVELGEEPERHIPLLEDLEEETDVYTRQVNARSLPRAKPAPTGVLGAGTKVAK